MFRPTVSRFRTAACGTAARFVAAPLAVVAALAACAGHPPDTAPHPTAAATRGRVEVAGVGAPTIAAGAVAVSPEDLAYLRERELLVPVAGVRVTKIVGTFDDDRSGGRTHHATDILAARGTPVLAADEGRVWKMRSNALGGITIYAVDPLERFVFYYAHLDHYRDGLVEGATVQKGDTLGYVGTTGNAPPDTPHLHFQVARLGADKRWWAGTPVDVLPFLRAADAMRTARAASAALTFAR